MLVEGETGGRFLPKKIDLDAIVNYKLLFMSTFDYMYHI